RVADTHRGRPVAVDDALQLGDRRRVGVLVLQHEPTARQRERIAAPFANARREVGVEPHVQLGPRRHAPRIDSQVVAHHASVYGGSTTVGCPWCTCTCASASAAASGLCVTNRTWTNPPSCWMRRSIAM